jgi:hypothetical protein
MSVRSFNIKLHDFTKLVYAIDWLLQANHQQHFSVIFSTLES